MIIILSQVCATHSYRVSFWLDSPHSIGKISNLKDAIDCSGILLILKPTKHLSAVDISLLKPSTCLSSLVNHDLILKMGEELVLERYQLVRLLGSGSFAQVFEGTQ